MLQLHQIVVGHGIDLRLRAGDAERGAGQHAGRLGSSRADGEVLVRDAPQTGDQPGVDERLDVRVGVLKQLDGHGDGLGTVLVDHEVHGAERGIEGRRLRVLAQNLALLGGSVAGGHGHGDAAGGADHGGHGAHPAERLQRLDDGAGHFRGHGVAALRIGPGAHGVADGRPFLGRQRLRAVAQPLVVERAGGRPTLLGGSGGQAVGFHRQRLFVAGDGFIECADLDFQRVKLFADLFRDGAGVAVEDVAVFAGLGRALLAQFLNAHESSLCRMASRRAVRSYRSRF